MLGREGSETKETVVAKQPVLPASERFQDDEEQCGGEEDVDLLCRCRNNWQVSRWMEMFILRLLKRRRMRKCP